jgi:predicted MFS family arabinose efflux permease
MALLAAWPTFPGLFLGLLLAACGKLFLDPTTHAFLGDQVPYRRRGLVIGLTEAAWSLSFLVGMPLVGWAIARGGWSAPFPWLAGLAALFGLGLWRLLPAGRPATGPRPRPLQVLRDTLVHRAALASLAVGFLISMANQVISIVYGAWLERAFELQVTALGATAVAIGLAELGGEGLVAGLVDHVGKRRAIALGIAVNIAAGLALPLTEGSLPGAMAVLFLFYLSFEFALVSVLALSTELAPSSRATLMSSSVASMEFSHALGVFIGPRLFALGLSANSACTAVLNVAAMAVLLSLLPRDEARPAAAGQ